MGDFDLIDGGEGGTYFLEDPYMLAKVDSYNFEGVEASLRSIEGLLLGKILD